MYVYTQREICSDTYCDSSSSSSLACQEYGGIHHGWRGESTRRVWAQGARFSGYGGGFTRKHPEIWLEDLYSPGEDPWIPFDFFWLLLSYIKSKLGQYGWKLDGCSKECEMCLRMPGKIANWIYEWSKTLLICDLPLKIREPVTSQGPQMPFEDSGAILGHGSLMDGCKVSTFFSTIEFLWIFFVADVVIKERVLFAPKMMRKLVILRPPLVGKYLRLLSCNSPIIIFSVMWGACIWRWPKLRHPRVPEKVAKQIKHTEIEGVGAKQDWFAGCCHLKGCNILKLHLERIFFFRFFGSYRPQLES